MMMAYRDRIPIIKLSKDIECIKEADQSKARELLRLPEFSKYANDMDRLLTGLLKTIIEYKNTDPIQYAFFMQAKIKEFTILALLLDRITVDAGVSNETN